MPPEIFTSGSNSLILRGLDKVHRVSGVLLHAGADGQHVGIEDDIRRRHADLFRQQVVRPACNADFIVHGYGLALFVEHHHYAGRAVTPHQPGMLQEFLLAFFQADGIDDRFALHAFQSGLDNGPVRTVDHHRHAGDVGLGGDKIEKFSHHGRAVQKPFVHVDVYDVRPALDLLPGDGNRLGQVSFADQAGEPPRTGYVGPLADHGKRAVRPDCIRLQPAIARVNLHWGATGFASATLAGRLAGHGLGYRANVRGRGAAASAHDIQPAVGGELAENFGHLLRRFVISAQFVGQSRVGMTTGPKRAQSGKFFDIRAHQFRPQCTVYSNAEQIGVADGNQKCLEGLAGKRAPAAVGDGYRGHHRQAGTVPIFAKRKWDCPLILEIFFDGKQAGLQVERVECGFGQEDIHPGFDQCRRLLVIRLHELIECYGPISRVVYVRRHRGCTISRADRSGDKRDGRRR